MRKIKWISIIMSILSCISTFSIGFSSWLSLSKPVVKNASGNYQSYGVLTIENVEMSVFQFSAFSFKDENHENSDEGVISIKYQIPKESLEMLGEKFTVAISLGYTGISDGEHKLFYNAFETNKSTNGCVVRLDGVPEDGIDITITEKDEIYFEHTFENDDKSQNLEFTVTYTFSIPDDDNNFRKTFGKYLIGSEIEKEGVNTTVFSATAEYVIEN